jgi:ribosome maturation factor RimP
LLSGLGYHAFDIARRKWAEGPFLVLEQSVTVDIYMTNEELTELLGPSVESLGYELADLEVKLGSRDGLLRVFIDKPEGIGLEDCEIVNRQISALLDVEDPLPGNYVLEVSSPGLDRRLTKLEHFERFMGSDVRVKLRFPLEGRKNFRGALRAANEENIEVEVDGKLHSLSIATIDSARLVPTV